MYMAYLDALWVDKSTVLDSSSLRHAPGLRLSTMPGPEINYQIIIRLMMDIWG